VYHFLDLPAEATDISAHPAAQFIPQLELLEPPLHSEMQFALQEEVQEPPHVAHVSDSTFAGYLCICSYKSLMFGSFDFSFLFLLKSLFINAIRFLNSSLYF
jgi:hypothetical protein